eukprot:scpid73014/ scgid13631/ 
MLNSRSVLCFPLWWEFTIPVFVVRLCYNHPAARQLPRQCCAQLIVSAFGLALRQLVAAGWQDPQPALFNWNTCTSVRAAVKLLCSVCVPIRSRLPSIGLKRWVARSAFLVCTAWSARLSCLDCRVPASSASELPSGDTVHGGMSFE